MALWHRNLRWHHSVRNKFEEHLVFYRAALKQFHPERTPTNLRELFKAERVENLSVYMTFGSTDILIFGYLHPKLVDDFRFKLAEILSVEHTPEYFAVSKYEHQDFGGKK